MDSEMEWRRRWRPNLLVQPWRMVPFAGIEETLLIKSNFSEAGYEILISDKVSMWHEALDSDDVKKRTMKLNPSIEAPVSKILDHVRDNFENAGSKKKDVSVTAGFKDLDDSDEQKILLSLSTKLAGLPFVWKFSAFPADTKMISDHLIIPLLSMTGELYRRQQELSKQLKAKDKEIEDLKAQGVKASRKHLETRAFDEVDFKQSMSRGKGVQELEGMTFTSEGQELYRELMTRQEYLQRDPSEDVGKGGGIDGMEVTPVGASWSSTNVSPRKSPPKSPSKSQGSQDATATKETELLRRQALEKRLAEESERKEQKKKRKKIKF